MNGIESMEVTSDLDNVLNVILSRRCMIKKVLDAVRQGLRPASCFEIRCDGRPLAYHAPHVGPICFRQPLSASTGLFSSSSPYFIPRLFSRIRVYTNDPIATNIHRTCNRIVAGLSSRATYNTTDRDMA